VFRTEAGTGASSHNVIFLILGYGTVDKVQETGIAEYSAFTGRCTL
jgi:hypothetical protein